MNKTKLSSLLSSSFAVVFLTAILVLNNSPETSGANPDDSRDVSGWAWSSNIGWISFNCGNTGSCSASNNYKVSIDFDTGLLSGYAWSSNIGWISFNQTDLVGCPAAPCEAQVTGGLNEDGFPKQVTGWAKVLSTNSWMSLSGGNYRVQLESNKDFSGWSWENGVVGWTSWSGSNYAVYVGLPSAVPIPPPPPAPGEPIEPAPGLKPIKLREIRPE